MPELDIADLRRRLRVRDNVNRFDGENGIPQGHAADRLLIGCELDPHYGMTCKLSLGYGQRIPSVTLDINPATVLFLEMGKALGVDVVELVEQLADRQLFPSQ
ncbi:hypothetical protein [Rahnella variigena]|uniref:hypothetical protein n=1 Tax=Rahnella variigena TaxID=574964 RepID=UPI002446DCC4|nr:hypothetical protein [Rahnella variigena]MDH2899253.1 hypothetical protein [Rahnella variigena]